MIFLKYMAFDRGLISFLWNFILFLFSLSAFVAKLFLREDCHFAFENASKKSEDHGSTIESLNGASQEAGSVRENDRGMFVAQYFILVGVVKQIMLRLQLFQDLMFTICLCFDNYSGWRVIITNYTIIL